MQLQIDIHLGASPELIEVLYTLAASFTAANTIDKAATASRKPRATRDAAAPAPEAPPVQAAAPAPEAPPVQAAAPAPEAPPVQAADGTVTREQLRAALSKLAAIDKPRAIALLAKHGATSIGSLDPEKYALVLAEAST